mmetsp:Transcript_30393/g.73981  ORF Transcript_30393/g.73981 Transcript_30393/m.73981 type:complete len:411 (-) Transcript_30393:385-1617(-)
MRKELAETPQEAGRGIARTQYRGRTYRREGCPSLEQSDVESDQFGPCPISPPKEYEQCSFFQCLRPANSFGSPAAALERLTIHPGEIEHHFSRRTEEMHKEIGKAVPPFWWKWQLRKWMLFPYNTVSFPLIFITGTYVTLHYTELANTCLTSIQSVGTFLFTHIYEPIKAIIGEIFFRHAETNMDREALKMSRESLQRMLKSYFDEKFPELPEATRATMAKDMDMKAVSEEYSTLVNYALSNTLRGDIPRLALIRMQFVEKEMLGLMDSVDFLLDKNEVNMQFTATVPAVVILYFAYRVLVLLWNRLMGHKSLSILSLNMRKEMLRLDRLLNLKDRTVTNNLSPIDMGKAMVIIHRLREQLRILESQLDPHEVEAMRTDLKELLGAFGPVTVRQQLAIIRRMRLSYRTVR